MYRFYGWEGATFANTNGLTPRDLYDLLSGVWRADTCTPRMRQDWSADNPTLGQCSIAAFLVQDLFGGHVFGVPLGDGNYHCFNEVDGHVFDLTSEQFGDKRLDYQNCPEQFREAHFAKAEKCQRYHLIRARLLAEYAVWLKRRGFNCCQAVLCACATDVDAALLKRLGAGFGIGMGSMEGTCGALCAAQMIMGLTRCAGKPLARDARALYTVFKDMCGATVCGELKGIETGVVLCECDDCVRNAVYALEGTPPQRQ